jgi:hypothetical protein
MSKNETQVEAVVEENIYAGEYIFKNPTEIDGEKVTSIKYDFSELNGKAIRMAKSELQRRGYTVAVKELDEVYHAALFAMASGLTVDNVEAFSMVDYNNVADIARGFLNNEE